MATERKIGLDPVLARKAKTLVLRAFRNGPIEGLHGGKWCPTCSEKNEFSKISDEEMKVIMKNAVNHVYRLLCMERSDPSTFEEYQKRSDVLTREWDEAEPTDV